MPPIRKALRGLNRLRPPAAVAAEYAAIVSGLEKAVAAVEAEPSALLEKTTPFTKPDRLAKQFGFKVCATMS